MTRRTAHFLVAVLSTIVASPTFAHSTTLAEISQAANRTSDLSRQALVGVFGDFVNNPLATGGAGGGYPILATPLQVTNGALLVVEGFFACYAWFKKLSQLAHSGGVFGAHKSTMWAPIRLVWG